jgi:VCBS repeat-containing protein
VAIYRSLRGVAVSPTLFYPQDLDSYARTTRFGFTLLDGATVSATVRDASGAVVLTRYDAAPLAAGSYAFAWDGRLTDGTMARPGRYTYAVSSTDGTLKATGAVAVLADGFRITISDATPGRRQRITIYATSAESLTALPRVRVYQPGLAGYSYAMTRSGSRYRVTITLKGTGRAGTIRFVVSGKDGAGRTNRATVSYPLH